MNEYYRFNLSDLADGKIKNNLNGRVYQSKSRLGMILLMNYGKSHVEVKPAGVQLVFSQAG